MPVFCAYQPEINWDQKFDVLRPRQAVTLYPLFVT